MIVFGQNNIGFTQLNLEQGLSNGSVTGIVQDSIGFVWTATKNGLNRYDGKNFKVYNQENSNLKTNDISSLLLDSKGRMWVGTIGGGIYKYDIQKDIFKDFRNESEKTPGLQSDIIHTIYEDRQGAIWLGTENGLCKFKENQQSFITYNNYNISENTVFGTNTILSLFEKEDGSFWVGTNGGGLFTFNRKTETFKPFVSKQEGKTWMLPDYILAIAALEKDELLIGTYGDGLIKMNSKEGTASNFFKETPFEKVQIIRAIYTDDIGTLWVGTDGQGLIKVTKNHEQGTAMTQFLHNNRQKNSLSSNTIHTLFKDNMSNLWIGTARKGISIIENFPENIQRFQSDAYEDDAFPILSIYKNNNGLWMGLDGGGLNRYDFTSKKVTRYAKDADLMVGGHFIQCIKPDGDGDFWLGTFTNGLVLFNPLQGKLKQYKRTDQDPWSLPYDDVRDVVVLPSKNLWVATWGGGLSYFDRETERFKNYRYDKNNPNAISSDNVISLLKDVHDELWIATYGGGLNFYNTTTQSFEHFLMNADDPNSLVSNYIFAVIEDMDRNHLWLGTKKGLSKFDLNTRTFKNFSIGNSLNTNTIVSLEQDSQGTIWMGTKEGIFKFNPVEEDVEAVSKTNQEYHINSIFKDTSGILYFGGMEGWISIDPKKETAPKAHSKMILTDFKLFNQTVKVGTNKILEESIFLQKEVTLKHDQNVFTIDFTTLSYPFSNAIGYAIKMEGFDKEWRAIGKQGSATFTNLAAGDYTFMVKSQNRDGKWQERTAALKVEILPPFWKTWWAYTIYAVLLLLLLWGINHYTLQWAEIKNNLRNEKILREQKEKIHQLKQHFFTNISHEIRTPLTLIMGTLNSLLKKSVNAVEQKQLAILKSSANRLLNLVNELLNIRKLETGNVRLQVSENDLSIFIHEIFLAFSQQAIASNIQYNYKRPETPILAWFDKAQLEKAIYNLFTNAFKFTKSNDTITVAVQQINDYIEISVKDSGLGIPENKLPHIFERFYQDEEATASYNGFGIGLSITKDIVELHSGTIQVKSELGYGSLFTISLPMGRDHFEDSQIISSTEGEDHINYYMKIRPDQELQDELFKETSILVIEDNHHLREHLKSILSSDFKVLDAENGKIGLNMAIEQFPDLIISDVMMPEMDGIALCYALKTNIMTSHIPVILLTARAMVENIMEGYETGADDYLVKPFNEDVLKIRIKNLLANRKQLRERYINEGLLHPKEVTLTSPDQEFLTKLNGILEKKLEEPEFSVDELASDMAMSHSGLYKKLKALTGMTLIKFTKDFRLNRAAQMLEQRKFSVVDVCFKVGYTDRKHFSKEFKKKFGQNPSSYGKDFNPND
ncbi:two-component regulator propeller domain-containing protein [Flavivirga amylovorans]